MTNFSVPPNTQQSFVGACNLPGPMHVVNVLPHMHQLGVGLDAAFLGGPLGGQTWLQSAGYSANDTLQRQYTPALDLSQGSGMTMTCTWNNTTSQTVMEGASGVNEMCMLFGYGWPRASAYSAQFVPGNTTAGCIAVAH
jgi:hypothetical protein